MHFHIVKTEFESVLFLHNIKSSLMLLYRLLARYNYIIKYIMKEELLIRIAYVRVSSIQQNEARQLEALKNYGIEKWFIEKVSGKNAWKASDGIIDRRKRFQRWSRDSGRY